MFVTNYNLRRRDLLHGRLRKTALGSNDLVAITATPATLKRWHLLRSHWHVLGDVRGNDCYSLFFLLLIHLVPQD